MPTVDWEYPAAYAITGTTHIKDTDNHLTSAMGDLEDWVNSTDSYLTTGLKESMVDLASIQTIAGAKTFSALITADGGVSGNVTGNLTGNVTGNADTATTLATTRAITLDGDSTGTVNFDGSAPVTITTSFRTGMIMMWSGAIIDIPSGWFLCDGLNGTPNLLNRAIIAAGDEFAVGATGDGSVPAHTHTANHSHTASSASAGAHTHTAEAKVAYDANGGAQFGGSDSAIDNQSLTTNSAGAHTHTITVNTTNVTTSSIGTGITVVPKHYALAYIMKG